MEIVLLSQAEEDLNYWKSKSDTRILKRIRALLADIQLHQKGPMVNGVVELTTSTDLFILSAKVKFTYMFSLCDTIIPNKFIRSIPPLLF